MRVKAKLKNIYIVLKILQSKKRAEKTKVIKKPTENNEKGQKTQHMNIESSKNIGKMKQRIQKPSPLSQHIASKLQNVDNNRKQVPDSRKPKNKKFRTTNTEDRSNRQIKTKSITIYHKNDGGITNAMNHRQKCLPSWHGSCLLSDNRIYTLWHISIIQRCIKLE